MGVRGDLGPLNCGTGKPAVAVKNECGFQIGQVASGPVYNCGRPDERAVPLRNISR